MMKHKSVFLFVLLLLLVFGFAAASAQSMETVTTVTLKTGALLAEYEEAGQLLDIAALRIHRMPEGYGAFALSLNDTDVLKSLFKLEENGFFVQSDVLGKQPLYFSWEDLQAFLMKQMEAYAQSMAADMGAMQAVTNGTLTDAQMEGFAQMQGMPFDMESFQALMDGSLTEEQLFEAMGIDQELLTILGDIQARTVTETGSYSVEGSDVANQKTVTEITGADINRVIDLPMVRKMIASQLTMSANDSTITQEQIDQQVDAQVLQIQQMIVQSNITITAVTYTQGDAFVAFTLDMNAAMPDTSGAAAPIGMHVSMTKTSIDTAQFYQMTVKLMQGDEEFLNQRGSLFVSDAFISGQYIFYAEPNQPLFEAVFNCDCAQADHVTAELGLIADAYNGSKVQTVFLVFDRQTADNVTDTSISAYYGGTVAEIKNALDKTSVITLNLHTVTQPDSGFFAALQNATPDTSLQLLQMSETDLQAYTQSIQQSLLMTLLTVAENLPPELSNAMMQSLGSFSAQ